MPDTWEVFGYLKIFGYLSDILAMCNKSFYELPDTCRDVRIWQYEIPDIS